MSTAIAQPKATAEAKKKFGPIQKLMDACGSPSCHFVPEPYEQTRWSMKFGDSAGERFMAAVRLCSVDRGSEWCLDERGNRVGAEYLAGMLGKKVGSVRNDVTDALKVGRIQLDKAGHIRICGDPPDRRTEGEDSSPVHNGMPTYVVDSIREQTPEQREVTLAALEELKAWEREADRDNAAAHRALKERVYLLTFEALGLPKKTNEKDKPAEVVEWTAKRGSVQVNLSEVPDLVQRAKDRLYNEKTSPVQNGASLLVLEREERDEPASQQFCTTTEERLAGSPVPAPKTEPKTEPPPKLQRNGADSAAESARLDEVRAIITRELGRVFSGSAPGEPVCRNSVAKLRGAPLDVFAEKLRRRADDHVRNKNRIHSMGIAESIANEVGNWWDQKRRELEKELPHLDRYQNGLQAALDLFAPGNPPQLRLAAARAITKNSAASGEQFKAATEFIAEEES